MIDQKTLSECDPGIQDVVLSLNYRGYLTTDSGDGKTKPLAARTFEDEPHVVMQVSPDAGVVESRVLYTQVSGIPGVRIECSFNPADQVFLIILFGLDDGKLSDCGFDTKLVAEPNETPYWVVWDRLLGWSTCSGVGDSLEEAVESFKCNRAVVLEHLRNRLVPSVG